MHGSSAAHVSSHPGSSAGAPNLPGPASLAHRGVARLNPANPQFPPAGRRSPAVAPSSFLPHVSTAQHSSQNRFSAHLAKTLRWPPRAPLSACSLRPLPVVLRLPPAPHPCNTPGFSAACPLPAAISGSSQTPCRSLSARLPGAPRLSARPP